MLKEYFETFCLRFQLYMKCQDIKTAKDLHTVLHDGFMNAPYRSRLQNDLALLAAVSRIESTFTEESVLKQRIEDLKWILIHP